MPINLGEIMSWCKKEIKRVRGKIVMCYSYGVGLY